MLERRDLWPDKEIGADMHSKPAKSIWLPCIALGVTLIARIFLILDFTDEQQYYGELIGLLQTNRLFSNDLFVQQTVWLLYYPFIKPYYSLLGEFGLIVFARSLLALTIIVFFFWATKKLTALGISTAIASWCSVAMSFSFFTGNVFAISYNSIGLLALAVFCLKFIAWEQENWSNLRHVLAWAAIPFLAAFAHPTIAIVITLLTIGRVVLGRSWVMLGRLLVFYALAVGTGLFIAVYFAPFEDYMLALEFSKGFGVGTTFFSSNTEINRYLISCALLITGAVVALPVRSVLPALAALGYGAYLCLMFVVGKIAYGISYDTLQAMSILMMLLFLTLNTSSTWRSKSRLMALLVLISGSVYAMTSGNGVRAMLGPMFIAFPILTACAASCTAESFAKQPRLAPVYGLLLPVISVVLMVSYWSYFPYRSATWFHSNYAPEETSPMLAGLRMGKNGVELLNSAKTEFRQLAGQRVLLTGYAPVLYFSLETTPETCMFFMHSLHTDVSRSALTSCLNKKRPDVVVMINYGRASGPILAINQLVKSVYTLTDCTDSVLPIATYGGRGSSRLSNTTFTKCRVAVDS